MFKCNALTNGLTILPDGKITPCCAFDNTYSEEYASGQPRFVKIQQAFNNGIQHPACQSCWTNEADGLTSLRTNFYNDFNIEESDCVKFLDLRNTNLCNLACRMCTPYFSSTLAKLENQTTPIIRAPLDNYCDDINFDKLVDVYFTGGEPFINPDHWRVLESIKNPQNVSLRYNSNLTLLTYKDKHIFDYWPEFKRVYFQASLEGHGDLNNSIRIGSDWDNIQHNINQLIDYQKKHSNLQLAIFVCISMLNVWGLEKLIDYALSIGISEINGIYIDHPDIISLNSLPLNSRDRVKKILADASTKVSGNFKNILLNGIKKLDTKDTTELFEAGMTQIQQQDRQHNLDLYNQIKQNLL